MDRNCGQSIFFFWLLVNSNVKETTEAGGILRDYQQWTSNYTGYNPLDFCHHLSWISTTMTT